MSLQEPIIENSKFQLYPIRWAQLIIFCLVSYTNASLWIFAAPIFDAMQSVFGVSSFAVNSLSLVYMLVYVPGCMPVSYLMERRGLKETLWWGSLLNVAGSWIRFGSMLFSTPSFGMLFAGQFLTSVAQLFVLSVPPSLAGVWFGVDERSTVTAIAVAANQLGVAGGFLLPPFIVPDASSSSSSLDAGVRHLLLIQSIQSSVCAVLCVLLAKQEPPTPPSPSSMVDRLPFKESVQKLLASPSYLMLLFGFGLQEGGYYAFSTVLGSILSPCGHSSQMVGWAGFVNVLVGVVGSAIAGPLMDYYKAFRITAVICYLGSALTLLWFLLVLRSAVLMMVSYGVVGLFLTAIVPCSLQLAVEYSYPVPEEVSAGLFFGSANLFGCILIGIMTPLADADDCGTSVASWIGLGATALGFVLTLFLSNHYAREAADREGFREVAVLSSDGM